MGFVKYQHIERLKTDAVDGIDVGVCYIFPKLDGTNASIWWDGDIRAGSRTRQLTIEQDNAGFYRWVLDNEAKFIPFFELHPEARLFGEWLVPHSLKTYREEAWRRFWIFDVVQDETHMPYELYHPRLDKLELDYIPAICKISNPTREQLDWILQANTYLIKDGEGAGEGIVIKNYDYENRFGRQTWAKLVRNEFKEANRKEFGLPDLSGRKQVEAEIAAHYVTEAFVLKTRAKCESAVRDTGGFVDRKILIPRLLGTCFHDIVVEETWNACKKWKNPTINFGKLQRHVIHMVKKHAKDLF
jgi:hypothetical protein